MFKVIVFDFDGVLVDSNRIKFNAWYDVFGDLPESKQVIAYDLFPKIETRTRYAILDEVYKALGVAEAERIELVAKKAVQYNSIIQSGISRAGLIDGARNVLESLSAKYRLYLNSSTPIESLEESVNNLDIRKFFSAIYGRPETKESALEKIFAAEGIDGRRAVFVGDGEADRKAAEAYGCFFIGILSGYADWTKNEKFVTVESVSKVPQVIDAEINFRKLFSEKKGDAR